MAAGDAFLAREDWLICGARLWESKGANFKRDYLVPLPNADLTGYVRGPAKYEDCMALTKQVLATLGTPTCNQRWFWQVEDELLLPGEAPSFWKEHSPRNWVNDVAAMTGVPNAERDFLGRWVPEQSDDYLRTTRAVVHAIQSKVAAAIRRSEAQVHEDVTLDQYQAYLGGTGLGTGETGALRLRLDARVARGVAGTERADRSEKYYLGEDVPMTGPEEQEEAQEVQEGATGEEYLVHVTDKRRFARLNQFVGGR